MRQILGALRHLRGSVGNDRYDTEKLLASQMAAVVARVLSTRTCYAPCKGHEVIDQILRVVLQTLNTVRDTLNHMPERQEIEKTTCPPTRWLRRTTFGGRRGVWFVEVCVVPVPSCGGRYHP
jgi:hypothetical protein